MFGSACTWCKIGLAAVLALIAAIFIGSAVASGGAGASIAAGLVKAGFIAAATPVITTLCGTIAAIAATLIATGIGVWLLADLICCRLLKVAECCLKEGMPFWIRLSELIEEPPVSGQEPGMLTEENCRELGKLIDTLRREKKIDDAEAQKMRDALKKHCPQ